MAEGKRGGFGTGCAIVVLVLIGLAAWGGGKHEDAPARSTRA